MKTNTSATDWEADLAVAKEYWFQSPAFVRATYAGQVIALLRDRILDTGVTLKDVRNRVANQYPNQPAPYLDADAEQEPPLFVLSLRFR